MKVNAKPRGNPGFWKLMLSVLAFSFFTNAQTQTVSGTVSDKNGNSLQIVSGSVEGMAGDITTNAAAKYSVNTHYRKSSFLNSQEAIANLKKSGFPALTPNSYDQLSSTDVPNDTFIRRLTYSRSEISVDAPNLNEAITKQEPDKLSTRIWWNK